MRVLDIRTNHLKIFLLMLSFGIVVLLPYNLYALGIQFSWTPNEDPIDGYRIYYKIGDNASDPFDGTGLDEGNSPIDVGNVSEFVIQEISSDQTYQFALTSYKDVGESEFSEIVTIRPDPPEDTTFSASFTWTPNDDPIVGYKLYYKRGSDNTAPFDGTGLNEGDSPIILDDVSSFVATGLSPHDTYHFVLTAFNEEGESGYSEVVTIHSDPIPIIIDMRTQ